MTSAAGTFAVKIMMMMMMTVSQLLSHDKYSVVHP